MGDDKPGDCVKVAIRMRPLSSKELGNNESSIVELEENNSSDGNGSVTINDPEEKEKPAQYAFDIVFGTQVLQQTVYETIGLPALSSMFNGYNGTIFAYGQTGSGKSWSMSGGAGELRGIIPRVNEELFKKADEMRAEISTRRFLVQCSFFEIYNEIIFDLLNPSQDKSKLGAGLQVKEHPVLGIYVKDLQEIVVSDADKLSKLMDSGTKNRAVSSTLMNSVSSRSHSIFTIKVNQKDEEDKSRNVFAKLNLVDLAGSERQKGTGASGQTLKEGANINKSLSALGNVINALVENANGKKVFVPFRNSKLTRVLQESLGGNSLCTMLAALSPAACNYEETLSTLRYANRAKAIKVSATKNEEASQISRLNAEIEELKKKLSAGGGGGGGGGVVAEEERKEMQARFQQQLAEMQQMVNSTWEEKAKISEEQEQQMAKAMEAHKKQQRAMQEERKKRLRLFQDQNDLELSIGGLVSTLQSLPSGSSQAAADAVAGAGDASERPCKELRSGELPQRWLKLVASIASVVDALKQQSQMAALFHSSLTEDLRLWVEGEEASDTGMARTGARRACAKLDTLKRECAKLASLEAEGTQKVAEFAAQVAEASQEWTERGAPAALAECRAARGEPGSEQEVEAEKVDAALQQEGILSFEQLNVDDVGQILKLISQQAAQRASELASLASFEMGTTSSLVVRGASLVPGAGTGPETEMLRALAAGVELDETTSTASAAQGGARSHAGSPAGAGGNRPREERPLSEWTHEDADDSVQGTEVALGQLVQLNQLNKKRSPQELLARPPPKFVHDVALLVHSATGYPPALSEDWPDAREGKMDVLQGIADVVQSTLGLQGLDFDPADVLKGKEVPKTLKMLQLLAIAAARDSGGRCVGVVGGAGKKAGMTKAGDLAQVLDAVSQCLTKARELQAARREGNDGHASPTRDVEPKLRTLQERLQDEVAQRERIEGQIEQLKKEIEESKATLAERNAQLEDFRNAEVNTKRRKQQLQQQLEGLRSSLLQRAQQCEGNPQVAKLHSELDDISKRSREISETKTKLSDEVKALQQKQVETETDCEKNEMELKRLKLRMAEGLDGSPMVQDEELLELQAEKQKWDMQVVTLEDQLRSMAEADDQERSSENSIMEQLKLAEAKHDEAQTQLQVIIEERDGLREGMELLWKEKASVDEELQNVTVGYTNLSDRFSEKVEEAHELERQIAELEALLEMLQANFEKTRLSPPTNGATTEPAAADDDAGSSHYSDEAFEEPDEEE
mmetsp:Transcript_2330/g.6687  ORF Transcript_2330/g.6687 Transcript_2330/m.6687 type:complete len:1259 (-) Transcript_2330:183-3959(-)